MAAPDLPEALLSPPASLVPDARPEDLVYIALSVGDGDCQLLLLPEDSPGSRRIVVVDAAVSAKLLALLNALEQAGTIAAGGPVHLVVATHPHDDHIGGMEKLLRTYAGRVEEFWEPGYWHTSGAYQGMMQAVEDDAQLRHLQPSSGTSRWLGKVRITALAPGVSLRGRFDSYGVDINNASIALKLEFPAARVVARNADRTYINPPSTQTLLLGADAQTLSWSQVLIDFPQLGPVATPVTKALSMAGGSEPLAAKVLKVPHHASKHGINLELMETIGPSVSVVSCGRELGKYNFPHAVAQEIMREGVEPLAGSANPKRSADEKLGIHYTGSNLDTGGPAGSVALILHPGGGRRLYRFCEPRDKPVDLATARLVR
jgi:competence protein ComEC